MKTLTGDSDNAFPANEYKQLEKYSRGLDPCLALHCVERMSDFSCYAIASASQITQWLFRQARLSSVASCATKALRQWL
jgi:hypothetical protein